MTSSCACPCACDVCTAHALRIWHSHAIVNDSTGLALTCEAIEALEHFLREVELSATSVRLVPSGRLKATADERLDELTQFDDSGMPLGLRWSPQSHAALPAVAETYVLRFRHLLQRLHAVAQAFCVLVQASARIIARACAHAVAFGCTGERNG